MRDDLYKTVPPTSAWRRVLKLAANRADWTEARSAMESAIRKDVLSKLDAKWLATLRTEINQPCKDMFGHDMRPEKIQAHRRSTTSQAERLLCDIAQGLWHRNQPAGLYHEALRELCRQYTDAGIEHVGALIRMQSSVRDAASAMRELRILAPGMTFDAADFKSKKTPKDKRSILELTIEIQV